MRFVSFNIDGGCTELRKRGKEEPEETCNCQLLCDSEVDSLEDFMKELKNTWKSYDIGRVLILKVDKSFEPVYCSI